MRGPTRFALAAVLCFAISAPCATAHAAAEDAAIAAKIRAFEVFGIRLGMTPDQVDAALEKHGFSFTSGNDPSEKNDLTHSGLCAGDYIDDLKTGKPVPYDWSEEDGGKCVYMQQPAYQGNILSWPRLLIYYCEDYPSHPGSMRVVQIHVEENLQTDADAKAFRQALFARTERRPTWESKDLTSGAYCSVKNFSGDTDVSPCPADASIVDFDPGRYDPSKEHGVTLEYSSAAGTLTLQDRDFIIAHRTSAWKAIQATRSSAKTPF